MRATARGTFEIELRPGPSELDGAVNRLDFSKIFHGDLDGSGVGIMLFMGDPGTGTAGYVAIERVSGRLHDREGGFALQQFGTMRDGAQVLHYGVVPGSGEDGLAGMSGTLHLTVDTDGTHRFELEYEL